MCARIDGVLFSAQIVGSVVYAEGFVSVQRVITKGDAVSLVF